MSDEYSTQCLKCTTHTKRLDGLCIDCSNFFYEFDFLKPKPPTVAGHSYIPKLTNNSNAVVSRYSNPHASTPDNTFMGDAESVVENKRDRFQRLARKRILKVIEALRVLGNLSNTSNYEYTKNQARKLNERVLLEVVRLEEKFLK